MGYVVGVADNSPADCAVASGKMSRRFFFGGFADQHLGFSARRLAHALKLYGRTR